jgi:formate dehydrogenase accessory protein FdhD
VSVARPRRSDVIGGGRVVRRYERGAAFDRIEILAGECATALVYNDLPFAVMMTTPEHLEDFARGFSLSEGIVADLGELEAIEIDDVVLGVEIRMTIAAARMDRLTERRRGLLAGTACGMCGILSIESALRPLPSPETSAAIPARSVELALAELPTLQTVNRRTGAAHGAAFADGAGRIVLVREDVGRHNALDKLVGALALAAVEPADGLLVLTSRCSTEMVQKAAMAGFPILAAISAPTTLAVELADQAGLTLIGFARTDGFNIYTRPERISLP